MTDAPDRRRYAPAAERNQAPILAVLQSALPPAGTILEIASGTGQHGAFFAPRLQPRHWLPSDGDAHSLASIEAWRQAAAVCNLHSPLVLDMTQPGWSAAVIAWFEQHRDRVPPLRAIVAINMLHIAPWAAGEGLFAGAGRLLPPSGVLYLYGPFKQNGQHTAPSNEAFDAMLRSQNPAWGVRDRATVITLGHLHGLTLASQFSMPANNLSLVFHRQS